MGLRTDGRLGADAALQMSGQPLRVRPPGVNLVQVRVGKKTKGPLGTVGAVIVRPVQSLGDDDAVTTMRSASTNSAVR